MNTLQDNIQEACENSGDVKFYNGYGGRGMYGRTCVGITGSHASCHSLIAAVIKELGNQLQQETQDGANPHHAMEDFEQKVDTLLTYSQDNMGYDVIIYWPELDPIVEEENQEIELHDADLSEG